MKISTYKIKRWKLALGRGLFVAVAQLLLYSALVRLELATVSALGRTIPSLSSSSLLYFMARLLDYSDGSQSHKGFQVRF